MDNLQGKNTTTNLYNTVIYYINKKLQINVILKVSSVQRGSEKAMRYFEKFSKLNVSMVSASLFSLSTQGTLVMYKVLVFSSSVPHYNMHKICLVAV